MICAHALNLGFSKFSFWRIFLKKGNILKRKEYILISCGILTVFFTILFGENFDGFLPHRILTCFWRKIDSFFSLSSLGDAGALTTHLRAASARASHLPGSPYFFRQHLKSLCSRSVWALSACSTMLGCTCPPSSQAEARTANNKIRAAS